MKLNLGCGDVRIEGYESVDFHAADVDRRVDLFQFPWPWDNESADAIAMFHFLEHVPNLDATVNEVYRILKPGGEFWVKVPHCGNPQAHGKYHLHRFNSVDMRTIGYNEENASVFWRTRKDRFETRLMSLNFRSDRKLRSLKLVPRILFFLCRTAANRHIEGWEWLHLPTDELEWKGIKVKTRS